MKNRVYTMSQICILHALMFNDMIIVWWETKDQKRRVKGYTVNFAEHIHIVEVL
jgi:hypothetical protein